MASDFSVHHVPGADGGGDGVSDYVGDWAADYPVVAGEEDQAVGGGCAGVGGAAGEAGDADYGGDHYYCGGVGFDVAVGESGEWLCVADVGFDGVHGVRGFSG